MGDLHRLMTTHIATDYMNWAAFAENYRKLCLQFEEPKPKRRWWPDSWGWWWRIPYGWWLAFKRVFNAYADTLWEN
jgi:hypothetical protein